MNFDYTRILIGERLKHLERRMKYLEHKKSEEKTAQIVRDKIAELKKALELLQPA